MEYARWAERYGAIREAFGYPFAREEAAAATLERLLPPDDRRNPLGRLRHRLAGRIAVIVGDAPDAGPPPVWRLPATAAPPALVAADGATATCLSAGLVPTLVVTDLDGPVPSEIAANGRGSLVLVHAHGDNVPALERWVPDFPGPLAGSWAGPPRPALIDVGGFTDGDRAAFVAEAAGASELILWGFDFDRAGPTDPAHREVKLEKLRWARALLDELAATARVPVRWWGRDGSVVPYRTGRNSTSTR